MWGFESPLAHDMKPFGRPIWVLGGVLALEVVVFVLGQHDFAAADPLWYAQIGKTLADDPHSLFQLGDIHPFVMRLGLTVPLSLIYRVFGVSVLSTNVLSLVACLGTVLVVYAAAPTPRAKVIGCLLCAACTPLTAQANMLNVDLPSAAMMATSVLFLQRRWFVAAMCAWFAAFLIKETALWCAPIWVFVVVQELRTDGRRLAAVAREFAPALAVGVALTIGYLALCAWLWHDPLARFRGIDTAVGTVGDNPSYAGAWVVTTARMTWEVPALLYKMFGLTLALVAAGLGLARGRDAIWAFATATMILLYWFGSSQYSAYTPLPISIRLLVPVLPFALIIAAIAADTILERTRPSWWRLALTIAFAAVVALPALRVTASALTRKHPETDAFAALRHEVRADPARHITLVCGEPKCTALAPFYFGLENPPNLQVVYARDFAAAPLATGSRVRVLVNRPRASGIRRIDPALDMTAAIDAANLPAIYKSAEVQLYDAGDGATIHAALQPHAASP